MMGRGKGAALLMGLGVCMFCAGAALGIYNLWDMNRAEAAAQMAVVQLTEVLPTPVTPVKLTEEIRTAEVEIPDHLLNPKMEMPVERVGSMDYIGILTIPSLGLELPVGALESDSALREAPCRYAGSVYTKDMVIAGHNYRQHFGRLLMISIGDPVTFSDVDGNLFSYRVVDVEKLKPDQIEEMCTGMWDLTLFTCTGGRQDRLAIRCETVE